MTRAAGCSRPHGTRPSRRRPHTVASPHGERIDPYYWLRDDERQDPEVLAYLNAENAYKERALAPAAGAPREALRRNHRPPEAGRCQRPLLQERLLVCHPIRAGQGASHRGAAPGHAGCPGGDRPRRQRAGGGRTRSGTGLLSDRRAGDLAEFRMGGVLRGLRRPPPVRAALQASAERQDPRGGHRQRRIRYRLGERQRDRAVRREGPGDAARPVREAASRGAGSAIRSDRVHPNGYELLHRGRQVQVRPLHLHPHGEHRLLGVALRARRRSGARVHGVPAHERDHEYQIDHLGDRFHHPHQLAGAQFPHHGGSDRQDRRPLRVARRGPASRRHVRPGFRACSTASWRCRCARAASPKISILPLEPERCGRVLHRER